MSLKAVSHSVSFMSHVACSAALLTVLFLTPAVDAATTLYWDANSLLAGSGTWDVNTTQNWSTTNVAGAPNATWNPNDGTVDAAFGGAAGTGAGGVGGSTGVVTVSGTINVDSIIFQNATGNYGISGGTLNFTNPNSSILMNNNTSGSSRAQIISSVIAGGNITVIAQNGAVGVNSFLTIGGDGTGVTNTFTGNLIFGGPNTATQGFSQININNPTALPTTATVKMQRNLCQLLFGAGGASGTTGYTATFNNNIVLNDGQSNTLTQSIGNFNSAYSATLGGVISGNANLIFQLGNGGGNGFIKLMNHETYTGTTQLNAAAAQTVAIGVNDALPIGTTFTMSRGRFDLAGFNQRIGGLTGTSGNGFITSTGGTTSTLTIAGNVIGDYASLIGASTLSGSNDDIALVLGATNTGSLTLSNASGNTYTGGTTINGGKLFAANTTSFAGSATGTGPVAVNSGGTLGGNGSVAGAITVASGGHIGPGLRVGTTIGTLSAFSTLALGSGSNLDIDLGAPAPTGGASDRVDSPNSTAVTVAGAHSVGINLSDPAGGAAGNGTYTVMTFQAGQFTGGTNTAFFTGTLPSPNSLNGATIAYHLADSSNALQDGSPANATKVIVQITGGPNALLWSGAASGAWDTSAGNFTNVGTGATGVAFANNDNVTFDDTGANTNPVTVAGGGVQPNVVTINNSTATYTFSGGDIKGSSVGGTGGLVLGGTGAVTINNNYTAAGPVISNKSGAGTATINGAITAATAVTVNGGAVTLAGANTYTGNNTINGGSLTVSGASATFGGGNVTVNAGSAVISAGVTNAILNSATLTLLGGGTANVADAGFISLATGINEQVGSLVLGATTQASGTYGATGSGATHINDEYFSGLGIITVTATGLPGDFNSDGKVDAGDYVTWRKNNGTSNALANDNGLGTPVGPAHYNLWRANFGNPPGAGSGLGEGSAVPEPATLLLSLVMVGSMLVVGRRKR